MKKFEKMEEKETLKKKQSEFVKNAENMFSLFCTCYKLLETFFLLFPNQIGYVLFLHLRTNPLRLDIEY